MSKSFGLFIFVFLIFIFWLWWVNIHNRRTIESIAEDYIKYGNYIKPFTFGVLNKGRYQVYTLMDDGKIAILTEIDPNVQYFDGANGSVKIKEKELVTNFQYDASNNRIHNKVFDIRLPREFLIQDVRYPFKISKRVCCSRPKGHRNSIVTKASLFNYYKLNRVIDKDEVITNAYFRCTQECTEKLQVCPVGEVFDYERQACK